MKTSTTIAVSVFKVVAKIPLGQVMTYGQVAKKLGLKSSRTVGHILHTNIDSEKVPCHRVIFADGSLSASYAFGGMKVQKQRLQNEGVKFKKDKVVLDNRV